MIEAIMKIGDFVSGMDEKGGLLSILFGMILAYDFRVLI
jgi:hypothetical protein